MDWSGLDYLWSFYHLFDLSFLQNPFTAEDPLIRKWCEAKFIQICFRWWNKLIYILDGLRVSTFSYLVWTILLFKLLVYKNTNWKKTTTLICWLLIVWKKPYATSGLLLKGKHDHSIRDTFKRVIAYNQIRIQGDVNPLRAAVITAPSSYLKTLLLLLKV